MTYNKNLDLINNIISKLKISSKFDYVENLNLNKIIVFFKKNNFILKILTAISRYKISIKYVASLKAIIP